MARNGSGTYVLPPSNPVVSGTVIESDWANDTMADLAAALTQSIAYDGQTIPIANLPMGGFHHTNVSDPSSRNQYATLGMVQDGRSSRVQITSGVDNLVGTLVGGATAYTAGAIINFFAPATNTGAMTINYNGIGARSLTDQNGLALTAGEIAAGEFVLATYTGTEFRLLTSVDAAVAADLYNLSISGQVRPPSNVYPALTIATGTTVNVPAGSAWIVPPGNDVDDAVLVSWAAQTITMQFLNSSFTTFVMVDESGSIQQIPGRAVGANFRHMAVLGVVEHITGTVNNVVTRPSIFGDDGYRNRDSASLLANTVINGALVTPNGVSGLQLDVAQGTIFIPGGTANTVDSPNTFNVPPQQNINFRTVAGQALVSALTATVPVGSYDANGAGIIAALPNPGDATVHRLFYLYGQYLLVYGQQVYSSVENALSMIAWDRTKFKKSLYLADATLLAEVVAIRTATNLNLIAQGAVVCPGGLNFSIGSPGGIAEAPIDGFPYGRRNAAWFQVLGATSPAALVDASITGVAPMLNEVVSPANTAGTSGRTVWNGANRWYSEETVWPDDKTYFRSYNPATGALRFTTIYDLATGAWGIPGNLHFMGTSTRIIGDFFSTPALATRVMFQSSVNNQETSVGCLPNGTSVTANYTVYGGSNPASCPFTQLGSNGVRNAIVSSHTSDPAQTLPLTIEVFGPGSVPGERLRFPRTENRIQADFSNPNTFLRAAFQSANPSNSTVVGIVPGAASQNSALLLSAFPDPGNSPTLNVGVDALNGWTYLTSTKLGGAGYLPLIFWTSDLQRLVINNDGHVYVTNNDGSFSGQFTMGNSTVGPAKRTLRVANSTGNLEVINANFSAVTHIFNNVGGILMSSSVSTFGDNQGNCGEPGARWIAVYAVNGTIQTSDARKKTAVAPLTPPEMAAAKELAGEIGTFQWLHSIEEKGADKARHHVGMTVQRAMEIMTAHGLDPMRYGFICYDEWEEVPDRWEDVDTGDLDEDGNAITERRMTLPGRPAGNVYSFRYDELNAFIARGLAQRLSDIEARLGM